MAKKLASSLKKKEPFLARFENEMENHFFFTFVNIDRNAQHFLKNINYIVLYEKNSFRFYFGPCKVPQPENMHFMRFPVGALPEVKD